LRRRSELQRVLREILHNWGYLEVQVPCLVRSPAMEEHLHGVSVADAWLHTSPEFALKRVLAAGLPRIYALTPCFREEEASPLHAREFTMLEWYRAGAGYWEIMDETEALLVGLAQATGIGLPTVQRLSWHDAFETYVGTAAPTDPEEANRLWVEKVEGRFLGPTFVYDYPACMAAFATIRGRVAERFELYWQGIELANAFTELLDPVELRERWNQVNRARVEAHREPHPLDERVIDAVSRHPRAGGIAIGWDRLLMLLLDAPDIHALRLDG